jgi:hypothetical protein
LAELEILLGDGIQGLATAIHDTRHRLPVRGRPLPRLLQQSEEGRNLWRRHSKHSLVKQKHAGNVAVRQGLVVVGMVLLPQGERNICSLMRHRLAIFTKLIMLIT